MHTHIYKHMYEYILYIHTQTHAHRHRDSDEGAAAAGIRRFPERVYIAYLDKMPDLVAPTVLWAPASQTPGSNDMQDTGRLVASKNSHKSGLSSLHLVHAVAS